MPGSNGSSNGGGGNFPTESTPLTVSRGDDWKNPLLSSCSQAAASSHKTIGMCGSLAIAVNSLAGPAILQLPFTFQQAGVVPTLFSLIVVAVLAAYAALHMANVVSVMPGNANFDRSVEFSDPFRHFWSERAYVVTQILFYCCTICVNIAAMVDTAQVVDSYFGFSFQQGTFGIGFDPNDKHNGITIQRWNRDAPCDRRQVKLHQCDPFSSQALDDDMAAGAEQYSPYILTLGFALTAGFFLPVCLMDLKENTAFQVFGWMVLMTISGQFILSFLMDGLDFTNVSMWGESWDNLLGVILFNFALVMAVPAWLSEKKDSVNVSTVVYGSTAISTALYVAVGLLGALAIPQVNPNMLEPMVSGAYGSWIRYGASFFSFFIIGLDIPLFSVLTRYNLTNSGLCSERTANILVVYLPWSVAWLFYQGTSVDELLSWGGIIFTGAVAFLLPFYIAIRVLQLPDVGSGSIEVYRGTWSKDSRWKATWFLFLLSAVSILLAIVGQIWAEEKIQFLSQDEAYLNHHEHEGPLVGSSDE